MNTRVSQVDEILGGVDGEGDGIDSRRGRVVPLIPLSIELELIVRNGEKLERIRCCHLSRRR